MKGGAVGSGTPVGGGGTKTELVYGDSDVGGLGPVHERACEEKSTKVLNEQTIFVWRGTFRHNNFVVVVN